MGWGRCSDIIADYEQHLVQSRATLVSVAVLTDTDNTGEQWRLGMAIFA